jgi:polar amino acid transport system permease protein
MDSFLHELWIARYVLLSGLRITVLVSAASILAGSVIGLVTGVALAYGPRPIAWLMRGYVDIVRGTPVLVLILASFYVLAIFGIHFTAIQSGVFALSLFCGAHMGEIVRGALQAIPKTQTEAARSIGLTFPKILAYVLVPQALRQILPVWINTGAELVKASTLLSVIGVGELLLSTQEIVGRNFQTLQFYTLAGVMYYCVNFTIESIGRQAERRLRG